VHVVGGHEHVSEQCLGRGEEPEPRRKRRPPREREQNESGPGRPEDCRELSEAVVRHGRGKRNRLAAAGLQRPLREGR